MNAQSAGVSVQRPLMPNKLPVTGASPILPSGVPSGVSNSAGLMAANTSKAPVNQTAGEWKP